MVVWPDLGTRVTLRYRRPPASVPPLTDVIGHLLAIDPMVRVRTKTGAIVEVAPGDVVALRSLTDAPVRTADIRNLEHAAAAADPPHGTAPTWLDGWLLRAGPEADLAANSAFPLDISAQWHTVPAITQWYRSRGLTPRLAIPDRLLTLPPGLAHARTEQILVRDIAFREPDPSVSGPTEGARTAVTDAPDGTRWLGLWSSRPESLSEALLTWGASRGATRAYLCVPDTDTGTDMRARANSLGFRLHHRRRYVIPPEALPLKVLPPEPPRK